MDAIEWSKKTSKLQVITNKSMKLFLQIPNGNHGLFHRYGIEALTIECVKKESSVPNQNLHQKIMALLKIVEGISRSLNNLLERFHQSFFFYVIISSDRFISIGDYMPSIGLLAGSLLIKSFLIWLKSGSEPRDEDNVKRNDKDGISNEPVSGENKEKNSEAGISNGSSGNEGTENKELGNANDGEDVPIYIVTKSVRNIDVLKVGTVFLVAHFIGVSALFIITNKFVHDYFHSMKIATQTGIFSLIMIVFAVSLLAPKFLRLNFSNGQFLNVVVLIELGAMLLSVSLLNFSMGFFLCVSVVPFAIVMNISDKTRKNLFVFLVKCIGHLMFHPLTIVYGVILAMSFSSFPEMNFNYILDKSFHATVDGITYSVVDSLVS